MSNPKGASLVR
ncbi:hypothetical protein Anas_11749 [Armadillidium nasatum]|uniref:Uncharacterized protein n=1 Tax=Armadillidium nasatum TaxID=96803 RepID=A0A5N5SJL2_9CRUS|nr:hypothetical protein Anas_11749 [Armadillidium nasatum]